MKEREYLNFAGITCKEAATAIREFIQTAQQSLRAETNRILAYRADSNPPAIRPVVPAPPVWPPGRDDG